MQAHEVLYHARQRPLRRAEYHRMIALGLFERERVELIRGMLVEMAPIGPRHSDPLDFLMRRFVRAIADERTAVRIQQPFAASDDSEPEPDLALVPPGRYAGAHPDRAFLVIEVAESSLEYDRETKGPLYAESGVPEYWIVDVVAQRIEVYLLAEGQGRYGQPTYSGRGQRLAPRAFPDVVVTVDELFP